MAALNRAMKTGAAPEVRKGIQEDAKVIWQMGKGRGEKLTLKNAWAIVRKAGQRSCFPVQAGVAEWMGATKVYRKGRYLISQEQIARMIPRLRPGDILMTRREWYLSNVGLPGFWPHASIYVGTPEERKKFFDDPDVKAWVRSQGQKKGSLDALLREKYPEAYNLSVKPQGGHAPRVLEARAEGVVFTVMENSAEADSAAAMRPRLTKRERAVALVRAYHYSGRPYDFDFDFHTDSTIVCSELVYKAYEPGKGYRGLRFPLKEIAGRKVTPANEFIRMFDEQYGGKKQQLDFVFFYDGHERGKVAVEAPLAMFRKSWRRPKWYLLEEYVKDRKREAARNRRNK